MKTPSPNASAQAEARIRDREALTKRLYNEGAFALAQKLDLCGEDLGLTCTSCGGHRVVSQRCDRRWCPVCAYYIASARVDKYRAAAERFAWPLFVTLTVRNDIHVEGLIELKKQWGKFRRRKLIRKQVRSGIVGFEITNKGNGWHPHIHALLDCRWLALHTPEIRRHDPPEEKTRKAKSAAMELENLWAEITGQETASIKIRRGNAGALVEVLKYSVKGSDLLESREGVAALINLMDSMRLMTTFGEIRKEMKDQQPEEDKPQTPCPDCGKCGCIVTDKSLSRMLNH